MTQEATTEKPVTPLEQVRSMTESVRKSKAWAIAKAETIETKITAAGGEVGADLKAALADLRTVAGD